MRLTSLPRGRRHQLIELADLPTIEVSKAGKVRRTLASLPASLEIVALVERQQAMPAQGASSGFKLGVGTGLIVGVLAALHVPFEWVEPAAWKRGVGLPKGSDKGASVELAQRLFPMAEVGRRDGRAEALLLALYGQRRLAGSVAA